MAGQSATLIVLAALAAASPAYADDDPSTALSGVGVSLPKTWLGPRDPPNLDVPAPKLVSTYPAAGQVVRPGVLILRVTFDLPMACWALGSVNVMDTHPAGMCATDHSQRWLLHQERLNWTILCHLEPNTRYSFQLKNFKGLSGRKADPYTLAFETSDAAPITTSREALVQDPHYHPGPRPADGP